jgi:hypothetical protein
VTAIPDVNSTAAAAAAEVIMIFRFTGNLRIPAEASADSRRTDRLNRHYALNLVAELVIGRCVGP